MANIRHYIDKQDFGEPRDWQDLEITIDWLNKKDSGSINVSELSFVGKANEYLQKRVLNGVSGGVGVFEGEPYKIVIGNQENPSFVFDGYLDFTEDMTVFGGEEITVALKKEKGDDWLNDVADGFSFAFLYNQGVVKKSDFVSVPYVINYVPDGMQIIVLSMSIYMMTKELIDNVKELAEIVADVVNASTPVIGVGVGLGAVAVTAWDLGDWIAIGLKALARIAFIIATTVAIIKLMDEVFAQILPKKRFHLGMTYQKMFERACQHLGMTFQSSIADLSWTHIPSKSAKGGSSGETGFPTLEDSISTFGGLIREMKKMFNADYRINNGVFRFERRDQFDFPSNYQMPNFFNDQERLLDVHGFNTDEMIGNYNIYWSIDAQDQNTLDGSDGRVFQAVTEQITTTNQDLVTIKGLAEIQIPFSLGVRKDKLTTVEEIAKVLGGIVDGLTGVFGKGTNFQSQIESRVGSLLLSSDFLSVPKVVKISGNTLAKNQRTVLSASKLWSNYHFINSFVPVNGFHNQFFRYKNQRVPMTIESFDLLQENNKATDDFGNDYEIEKVIYNPTSTTALIDFRVKRIYTNNLKITLL